MKEAIGGAMTINIILIFMLIVNAYLAFSVNYTKAFRIKNNIVSIIEKNEGLTDQAQKQIYTTMVENGYNVAKDYVTRCGSNGLDGYRAMYNDAGGYCVKVTVVDNTGGTNMNNTYVGAYYSVVSFINIDIPVLNKIFPVFANVFSIKGETKTIYSSGFNTELLEG